jgi:uncharacterized coiled-coil DUF342 family protein
MSKRTLPTEYRTHQQQQPQKRQLTEVTSQPSQSDSRKQKYDDLRAEVAELQKLLMETRESLTNACRTKHGIDNKVNTIEAYTTQTHERFTDMWNEIRYIRAETRELNNSLMEMREALTHACRAIHDVDNKVNVVKSGMTNNCGLSHYINVNTDVINY